MKVAHEYIFRGFSFVGENQVRGRKKCQVQIAGEAVLVKTPEKIFYFYPKVFFLAPEMKRTQGWVILPFLAATESRAYAARFSFMAGVMPPMPMLGRSLL